MEVKAKLNYLRIAPRKVRLVADLIRWKKIEEAQSILKFTVKKGAHPLLKLLNSAIANAKNNFQIEPDNLYISKITVDEGPKYKRWMPRARGSASEIQKKTSHITLILNEAKGAKKSKKIKKGERKPVDIVKEGVVEEKIMEENKTPKYERPKTRPTFEKPKPKIVRGINKIFRRKVV